MDMMPPEAPTVSIQTVYQDAARAFDRLVTLQAWLATEQADIPAPPEAIERGTLHPYLGRIDAYWNASPTDTSSGLSRRSSLAERVAGAAVDLALLGHEDGNLDDAALALVRSVVAARSSEVLPHVKVRELMFGETVHGGSLIVHDERTPTRTLVFSVDRGWESFRSLAGAHDALEQRARLALASASDLPGITRSDLRVLGAAAFVNSRDIVGDPFEVLVDRVLRVQSDKLSEAWFEFALADDAGSRDQRLADTVFDALRLDRAFDVATGLAPRHAALVETFNAQRLLRVPLPVAEAWKDTEENYLSTLREVAGLESDAGLVKPQGLAEYATDALTERLQALGVTHVPGDIHVRIDRSLDPDARLESLQSLFEGPEPARIRLVDLAYQNIAPFSLVHLSAIAGDGSVIAALDDAAIRELVRGIDLSTRYQDYIDASFRSGTGAEMRREHASRVQWAHMRFQAAEARLSYYLEEAPRWFGTERDERAYRWIQAVLDAPLAGNRARVEGHEIVVQQMTYRGTPLRDILVMGVRNPGSVPNVVLYTPGAPDGITFREFADRGEAARRFSYHPAFREYLLDRLPVEYAEVLPHGSARRFAGSQLANWVLGAGSTTAYTWTADRFGEREVQGDFLEAAYETDVQHGLHNTRPFTRSADQAQWDFLAERGLSRPGEKMVAAMLMGVVTAPAHAAQAAWRLYDTAKAGDTAQTIVDFADFYMASLSVIQPLYVLNTAPVARGIVGARFKAAGPIVEPRPAAPAAVLFESRFVAKGIRKTGREKGEGIFTIAEKTYIEHEGKMYRVRYDADYATWRLTRHERGGAFAGGATGRTPAGSWGFQRVGLRGGSGRGAAGASARRPELFDEYMDEVEVAFPDPVERDLVTMQMRSELTGGASTSPITAAQRTRWAEAATRAQERFRAAAQPRPPQHLPINLSHRYVAAGFGHVASTDVPSQLWFYGSLPYKSSDLLRTLSNRGYVDTLAQIRGRRIAPGLNGVRVTTAPPTASIDEIQRAVGNASLQRHDTFSVRIDARTVLLSSEGVGGGPARVNLLSRNQGPANVFYFQPTEDDALRLFHTQFEVTKHLPPPR